MQKKSKEVWEYGDFQTPDDLAMQVVNRLKSLKINPASIVEPTCGKGNMLISAIRAYPGAERIIGVDINSAHLDKLCNRLVSEQIGVQIEILHQNFFELGWKEIIEELPQPILIIGNPPWVTSTELSQLQSSNLPEKSNFQGRNGLDALTGKSNFDISEWMLLQHLSWLKGKAGVLAMLCKTIVARKILVQAWQQGFVISSAKIYKIDAKVHFNASVDACLLTIEFGSYKDDCLCAAFHNLTEQIPFAIWGFRDGLLLSDSKAYHHLHHLKGEDSNYVWRSGIKHDCAKVMELSRANGHLVNGNGVSCNLEDDYVYPLLKSSDIGNNRTTEPRRYMLVTQKHIGEETYSISEKAPYTWNYLQTNRDFLAKRASSIYRNRPDFSIFGVGDYTFAPWKVAISGFYKHLNFVIVAPTDNKPIVFDDTVYFLSCHSQKEATFIVDLLNSPDSKGFLSSMIFWEDKRPITIELLKQLNLQLLARHLKRETEYLEIIKERGQQYYTAQVTQLRLFEKRNSH